MVRLRGSGLYPAAVLLFGEASSAFYEESDDEASKVVRSLSSALQGFFMVFQGQPEAGQAQATAAAVVLRNCSDPEALWLTLQAEAMSFLYMRSWDEHNSVLDEGIALGDQALGSPFWGAGLKSRRAFGALVTGDLETAKRLLREGLEVCRLLGEHYYMSWMLGHQARISAREGRIEDAIDLFGRSLSRSEDLGYKRGVQVSSAGLGGAQLAAGNLVEAESAFLTSLAAAEQMSMIREMLGLVAKCAHVRAAMGSNAEAVEMLATVVSEPLSSQQLFTDNIPTNQFAEETLGEIEKDLSSDDYSAAYQRGTERAYESLVKSVLDGVHGPNG